MIVTAFIQGELGHLLNAQAKAVDQGVNRHEELPPWRH